MKEEEQEFDCLFKNYHSFFDQFEMDRDNIVEVYNDWKEKDDDTVVKYLWAIMEKLLY